jgi:hypothetical protein
MKLSMDRLRQCRDLPPSFLSTDVDWLSASFSLLSAALYDLVNSYMDLDGLDPLNSSEDRHDDRDSRASGTRAGSAAESSENEAESQSTSVDRKDGAKSQAQLRCRG